MSDVSPIAGRAAKVRLVGLLAWAGVLGGCEHLDPLPDVPRDTAPMLSEQAAPEPSAGALPEALEPVDEPGGSDPVLKSAEVYPGRGSLVRSLAGAVPKRGEGEFTFNFEQTDLREVVKVVLGDTLKVNYLLDPDVGGLVSMHTARPIAREDVLIVLENILRLNGAALVETPEGYRVLPLAKAPTEALPARVASPGRAVGPGFRTVVIPLRYMAVSEAETVLEPFINEDVVVATDSARNLLIVSGTRPDVSAIRETVAVFDVDWLKGMSIGLFPLDYADAETVVEELNGIFGEDADTPVSELVRMVPIERLNAVLMISPQAAYVQELGGWIERLDRADDRAGQRLYVYRVQNGKASDLSTVLTDIFQTDDRDAGRPPVELAPGLRQVELDSGLPAAPAGSEPVPPAARAGNAGSGVALVANSTVRVIADEVNNALVILATAREFRMVEEALKRLDVTPLQVLIEASILEVRLEGDLEYGLEWFFKNGVGGITEGGEGRGTLDLGAAGLAALSPGFSYSILDAENVVRGVLNALASRSQVNVLSSPSLMVLDNKTAAINVGDRVPIPTRQSVSNIDPNAPTVNEISYEDTGVLLEVTPRVNTGGLITMEINQQVSDVTNNISSGIDAPVFQQRSINSTVAVQSGNTVVLGGLIRENETDNRSGVPGLYRIPVLGNLFGATTRERRRTELLVLITPRAVRSEAESRQVTKEFRNKLKGLQPPSAP